MNATDQRKPRKYKTLRRAAKAAKALGCRLECRPMDVLNLMEEVHLLREQLALVSPEFKEWNALDYRFERAKLLGAVPDLLSALIELERATEDSALKTMALAAIAKATGSPQ